MVAATSRKTWSKPLSAFCNRFTILFHANASDCPQVIVNRFRLKWPGACLIKMHLSADTRERPEIEIERTRTGRNVLST
jgi:hypothetical protein